MFALGRNTEGALTLRKKADSSPRSRTPLRSSENGSGAGLAPEPSSSCAPIWSAEGTGNSCGQGQGLRNGNPAASDPWQRRCGFYPGSRPGECTSGTAATFESARAAFMAEWAVFLSKRTVDFDEWRQESGPRGNMPHGSAARSC